MKDISFDKSLGSALRSEREKKNLSQQDIADRMGVTKMAVSNWESGNRSMYAKTVKEYCRALGISIASLYEKF
ncbi:helix-turn-helix domain-containing protein [Anaerolactibacter massiliensis]|uniref:helix-turn-helix domain-containing protein n=1 Tax=Anaerolactibacter massiliensis TaxID=2044573 RepID=UPI000CF84712|nr:helix-turn-helix transcriptional regulator [Anaerolactibacter massiliensis]